MIYMKKQDNFWKIHLTPTVVGALIVLLALYIVLDKVHIKQQNLHQEKQKTEQIKNLDAQIQHRFQSVDSLRNVVNAHVTDSLMRHPEYKFVVDNQSATDSLRTTNQEMLNRAYNAARKHAIFDIVRQDESVFNNFAYIPAVNNIKWRYYTNKNKIRDFDKRKQATEHLPRLVRAHFDSVANSQIYKLQLELDSLLNQKNQALKSR